MRTVNIRYARTNLSKLIEEAAQGEPFIIAKAGKPMVKVLAVEHPQALKPRIGFMRGRLIVPEDFDALGREAVEAVFNGRL